MNRHSDNQHTRQKKIALINDFCGFGRCSLTVSLPIVSALGIQACPVPTAVFSNHTAYRSFYKHDMTDALDSYIAEWRKLSLSFDAVLAGYLASPEQIDITTAFVHEFQKSGGVFILDPVMGDNGKLYQAYAGTMLERMKELTKISDVLTPNLTESCFLTGTSYDAVKQLRGKALTDRLRDISAKLSERMNKGIGRVVISGIESDHYIGNYIYDHDFHELIRMKKTGPSRCGTGDVFSSIISACLVNGDSLKDAVVLAARFIGQCITVSDAYEIPLTDGVAFEDMLCMLTAHRSQPGAKNNH